MFMWSLQAFEVFASLLVQFSGTKPLAKGSGLGGSWNLVTTYNWVHNPPYNWGKLYTASWGDYK